MRHADIRAFLVAEGENAYRSMDDCLTPRQRQVLQLLYVPDELGQCRSPAEVALDFNVTQQRIVAIERAAMYAIAAMMRRKAKRANSD